MGVFSLSSDALANAPPNYLAALAYCYAPIFKKSAEQQDGSHGAAPNILRLATLIPL